MMKNINGFLTFFLCLLFLVENSHAYQLGSSHWPENETTMYVDIAGADGLWNESFEDAMFEWTEATGFSFYIIRQYADPCNRNDRKNGVGWERLDCGDEFGTALAVTHSLFSGLNGITSQADITFDTNRKWNVYDGALQKSMSGGTLYDFHRVALHELGHVLGLGHVSGRTDSIMQVTVSNIYRLTNDDVNGVSAIYGTGFNTTNFINKCINKFPQYVGMKNGSSYNCGSFICQKTSGGRLSNVIALALHESEHNNLLWYFTDSWRSISFANLGFCN